MSMGPNWPNSGRSGPRGGSNKGGYPADIFGFWLEASYAVLEFKDDQGGDAREGPPLNGRHATQNGQTMAFSVMFSWPKSRHLRPCMI